MQNLSLLTRLLVWMLSKRPEVLELNLTVEDTRQPATPQVSSPAPDPFYEIPNLEHLDDDKHVANCRDFLDHLYGLPTADPHGTGGRSEGS